MLEAMPEPPLPDKRVYTPFERAVQVGMLGLAAARVYEGFKIRQKVLNKSPDERTWEDAGEVALYASTDGIDGLVTRWLNITSRVGAVAEELADKFFTNPGFQGLKKTGEISAGQADAQLVRDVLVTGMRAVDWHIHRNDSPAQKAEAKATAVSSTGKRKTAAQMLTKVIEVSPVSKNHDLLERGIALSTGLSLTSGGEYALKFVSQFFKKDRSPREEATARNSPLRETFAHPIDKIVTWLDETFPELTADQMTDIGKWVVILSAALAVKYPDKPLVPTVGFAIGSLIDAGDGKKSEIERARTGEKPTIQGK
ncbi:MAG TPA: CDP-alcohol phosphatidyltransferase family protein, partial [Candidatus Saccharimonadales bacterium]